MVWAFLLTKLFNKMKSKSKNKRLNFDLNTTALVSPMGFKQIEITYKWNNKHELDRLNRVYDMVFKKVIAKLYPQKNYDS